MARRGIPEINAGSMADIAFLLLIFFLVTTTIDHEEGILRILPQKTPPDQEPIEFKDRDVFMVKTNFRDELLVEGEIIEIGELKEKTIEWYGSPMSGADIPGLPKRVQVNTERCQKNIAAWQEKYTKNPDDQIAGQKVDLWKAKLKAVREIGPYYEMPKSALIAFQSDNGTSYGFYIQVQDVLTQAIAELRDEYCIQKFGLTLDELNPDEVPEHSEYEKILELVYPQRISETTKSASAQ